MTSIRSDRFTDGFIDRSLTDGVILHRDDAGKVHTNVPHVVLHHSPDGYEFGYPGSGPADLALNLAENMLKIVGWNGPRSAYAAGSCFDRAWTMHQELKQTFLVDVPRNGTEIPYDDIKGWILDRLPADFVRFYPPALETADERIDR